jgi:hypothetical protein
MRSRQLQFDIDLAYILCQAGCVRLFYGESENTNKNVYVRPWEGKPIFEMDYPTDLNEFRDALSERLRTLNEKVD